MAIFTDAFATDPLGTRMTVVLGTGITYDAGNQELDVVGGHSAARYESDTGSRDMECQVTMLLPLAGGRPGPCVRFRPGADTCYFVVLSDVTSGTAEFFREVAGSATALGSPITGLGLTGGNYYSWLLTATGTGATVTLDLRFRDEGASKPASETAWVDTAPAPAATVNDTDAARILDTDAQRGGIRKLDASPSNADWFKERAISDRAGPPSPTDARIIIQKA